ncbi:glycosyl hydrolase, family 88 [Lentisphaera araneosa HTCC2155]|uniref:Glycosyl hydrolase, family 88 n=1 Tax=Lentisphaera araneosa HTCC2155 TaxID=313628 RepID=A6DNE5_9BACT|nr:glycoside hydrolase family 88 protein [Lentisphaera araneosa]EDM26893.1 glycosyl hydrolase, family 88 [Lentisphaera araneosa HTCC2155]
MFKSLSYLGLMSLVSLCFSCAQNKEVNEKTRPEMQAELLATMEKSHDWMWKNRQSVVGGSRGDWNWTNATWFVGSMELYKISKNPELLQQLKSVGQGLNWTIGDRTPGKDHNLDWYRAEYAKFQNTGDKKIVDAMETAGRKNTTFAANHTIVQVYADMAKIENSDIYLKQTTQVFGQLYNANLDVDMTDHLAVCWSGEWSWCDSLFMSPPAFAKVYAVKGDIRYLDFMNRKWWKTHNLLYDKQQMLFYRDATYFDKKEANGEKVFSSYANAYVMGGLVRVLEVLPEDYPDRAKYLQLFKEMASKVSSLQAEDGFWRPSLLDPMSFPAGESSGTGLFCYALAWGINNGHLNEKVYSPVVKRSINALMRSVNQEGKVGWVQAIGKDPKKIQAGDTEVYGVGAFLLAASEVYKLLGK